MPLLPPLDGVSPEQQEQAEALVAAAIGASSLKERPVAQSGLVRSGVILLNDGPLTALTTFSLNGYAAAPVTHPWHVELGPLATAYPYGLVSYAPTGGMYAMTYTAGWTAENLPDAIRAAVATVSQNLSATAGTAGLKEYKLGDVTEKYADSMAAAGLPEGLLLSLAAYKPLRF